MEGGKWARGDGKEVWKPREMGFRERRVRDEGSRRRSFLG